MPVYWSVIPLSRSGCITDPIEGANRTFVYRYGCSRIIADAPVIKRQLVADNRIAPEKIEVIGSAGAIPRLPPNWGDEKVRVQLRVSAEAPPVREVGVLCPGHRQ